VVAFFVVGRAVDVVDVVVVGFFVVFLVVVVAGFFVVVVFGVVQTEPVQFDVHKHEQMSLSLMTVPPFLHGLSQKDPV
jgi:hypothetical protein